VVEVLVALARGWLAVLRSGVLTERQAKRAQVGGEHAAGRLRAYLGVLRDPPRAGPDHRDGSRLDPLRARLADSTLADWGRWEETTGRVGGPG
jgi:hypothetical protein